MNWTFLTHSQALIGLVALMLIAFVVMPLAVFAGVFLGRRERRNFGSPFVDRGHFPLQLKPYVPQPIGAGALRDCVELSRQTARKQHAIDKMLLRRGL